jgi:hypothetical protein
LVLSLLLALLLMPLSLLLRRLLPEVLVLALGSVSRSVVRGAKGWRWSRPFRSIGAMHGWGWRADCWAGGGLLVGTGLFCVDLLALACIPSGCLSLQLSRLRLLILLLF